MSKSKTYVYHTSITYLHISTHLVVIHQNAGQMHNILDRLSFFPHMPFSLLFKSSRFMLRTKAAPAFHMKRHTDQNRRFLLRIETAASNHQNIQIWNSLEFLLSLLFYYFVLFWYGMFILIFKLSLHRVVEFLQELCIFNLVKA